MGGAGEVEIELCGWLVRLGLALLAGCAAALVPATAAAVLDGLGRAPRMAAAARAASPRALRHAATWLLAGALPVVGPAAAGASETPIRSWLSGTTPTSAAVPDGRPAADAPTPTPSPGAPATEDPVPAPLPGDRPATEDPVATPPPGAGPATRGGSPPTRPPDPAAGPEVVAGPPGVADPGSAPPADRTAEAPDTPATTTVTTATYTVRPGDCLWSVAARHLPPGASNLAVDRGWRRIYAANRSAIGPDPGLVHPGLVLALPPLDPQP